MKEAKSYRSASDLKRTSAYEGPYRPTVSWGQKVAGVLLAIAIGLAIAILLVLELSK